MCGRFALFTSLEDIQQAFGLKESICMVPRYNIAPQEMIPIILPEGQMQFMQWGFLPRWSSSSAFKPMINARIETATQKPMFRESISRYRCLIPMSGYYEWRQIGSIKQPFFITASTRTLLSVAAIWSPPALTTPMAKGTVAILTTPAIEPLVSIHERMPLILTSDQAQIWLSKHKVDTVLSACQQTNMSFSLYPVTRHVNNPAYDDRLCILPLNE